MLRPFPFFSVVVAIALVGCSKPKEAVPPPSAATSSQPEAPIDPCTLLTSEEIQAVMGEAVKGTQADREATGGFVISQCFFALPTRTDSVTLRLVQRGSDEKARDPRQAWQESFARDLGEAMEKRKDQAPQKIADLGDEAFWMGGPKAGGLYVLKGNRYIRLSIGGEPSQGQKIEKASTLARAILERL